MSNKKSAENDCILNFCRVLDVSLHLFGSFSNSFANLEAICLSFRGESVYHRHYILGQTLGRTDEQTDMHRWIPNLAAVKNIYTFWRLGSLNTLQYGMSMPTACLYRCYSIGHIYTHKIS